MKIKPHLRNDKPIGIFLEWESDKELYELWRGCMSGMSAWDGRPAWTSALLDRLLEMVESKEPLARRLRPWLLRHDAPKLPPTV